ncbi:MAG: hypothetical protein ACUVT1_02680 [Anaerolineae bacterium]
MGKRAKERQANTEILVRLLKDPAAFSRHILRRPLRPYQVEPLEAIVRSVLQHQGLAFTVMFARQMGKNELSAHLEAYLLNLFQRAGGTIVKTAPTFQPQLLVSKMRLESLLDNPLNAGRWRGERGYMIRLGKARAVFLSGDSQANVVGATAGLLLEVDEAQDFDFEKYQRDFRPMASTANATTVLYGTAWSEDDMLWRQKLHNLEAERRDGMRRHFENDWHALADMDETYRRFVEGERQRLGEEHPLFMTQYALRPLSGAGRLFSPTLLERLAGTHRRGWPPAEDAVVVAGLDVGGGGAGEHDASVLTLAAAIPHEVTGVPLPRLYIIEHVAWWGEDLTALGAQVAELARAWQIQRLVVDATGIGAGAASFLRAALGAERVEPVVFSLGMKSRLGYALLAAVGAGRLQMYADDDSPESRAFWAQCRACRREVLPGQQMRFFVPAEEGHDDYVVSLALCVHAAGLAGPPPASTVIEAADMLLPWE